MNQILKIELCEDDLGQMLDGLRIRAESWSKTADYLAHGHNSGGFFVCEECSNPEEARSMARRYKRIIFQVEQQVQRQGGRM